MLRRSLHPFALLTCMLIMLSAGLWTTPVAAIAMGTAPGACLTVSTDAVHDQAPRHNRTERVENCHAHEVGCAMACGGLFAGPEDPLSTPCLVLYPAALSLRDTCYYKGRMPVPDSPPPKVL